MKGKNEFDLRILNIRREIAIIEDHMNNLKVYIDRIQESKS